LLPTKVGYCAESGNSSDNEATLVSTTYGVCPAPSAIGNADMALIEKASCEVIRRRKPRTKEASIR